MKKFILLLLIIFAIQAVFAQTTLVKVEKNGDATIWNVLSRQEIVAKGYSFENADIELKFYPRPEGIAGKTAFTGTYTSSDGKLAAMAYENGKRISSNSSDPFESKSNAYLTVFGKDVELDIKPSANCIPVYQVLKNGKVTSVVTNLAKSPTFWRFLIIKTINRKGALEKTFMIVDFIASMTISEACAVLQGMQRNNSEYSSIIDACLLDTGYYRPFLLNGNVMDGVSIPQNQSNVIVIN